MPFDKWACDHLEEQLFPTAAWGRRYVGSHSDASGKNPSVYRVVSAVDKNKITFTNGVNADVTLDRGKYVSIRHG